MTSHRFLIGSLCDPTECRGIAEGSVHLVVTSPPYPMIAMWDDCFASQSPEAGAALARDDADRAFEEMHLLLDRCWDRMAALLCPGGIACINVGDAVRTIGGRFRLFSNHARIIRSLERLGLTLLPMVLWRKPTNAPNKFLGSGMLPGAYVTLEHEFVLIARKGDARSMDSTEERERRRRSAMFWEERNVWYSDLWSLIGSRQALGGANRGRSAAFPLELPYRLVAMYSWEGDTVLDPFSGTGTTSLAAMALARHSTGLDTDASLCAAARARALDRATVDLLAQRGRRRIADHERFLRERSEPPGHRNEQYGFAVVTRQETELTIPILRRVEPDGETGVRAHYAESTLFELESE